MTLIKNKFLPLLLALLMVVTMLPVSALAADDISAEPVTETEDDTISGTVGDSAVIWTYDSCCGRLTITGEGGCETFASKDDQPWAAFRTEIREVWFNSMDTLTIENLAYWFDGCTVLETAEAPYTTPVIGTRTFADCPSLYRLMLYYGDAEFTIAQSVFAADTLRTLEIDYIAMLEEPMTVLSAYDWSADNRAVFYGDVYGTMMLATGYCVFCDTTCSYTVEYEQWSDTEHCTRHWCSNCGKDQCGGVNGNKHTFNSSGICTLCGYNNGSGGGSSGGGGTTTCYHNSTYKSWSGCNWTEYCSSCGAYIDSGTSHGSTYTTWSGCSWYEYCNDCGQLMDSGTSHSYSYGSWQYYNSSQHRRTGTCSCGATTYSYGYHYTTTKYSQYSSTQHSYGSYCSTCDSYVGSVSYANHTFSYGVWQNYSASQHRRLKTCSTCGYNEYEYSSHSLSYGSWTNYSATQHRRTVNCATCGYSSYEYASHAATAGAWSPSRQLSISERCPVPAGTAPPKLSHTV